MTQEYTTAYRFFDERGGKLVSRYGQLTWPRPNGKPGRWVKHDGPCVLCESGLHASPTPFAALREAQGWVMGRVHADGIGSQCADKFSAKRMRIVTIFDRRHVVGLAALAAAMSLKYYEAKHKGTAPRKAIEAAIAWIRNPSAAAADAAWRAAAAAWRNKFNALAVELLDLEPDQIADWLTKKLTTSAFA